MQASKQAFVHPKPLSIDCFGWTKTCFERNTCDTMGMMGIDPDPPTCMMHVLLNNQISRGWKISQKSQVLILCQWCQINDGSIRTKQTSSATWNEYSKLGLHSTPILTTSQHLWEWHTLQSSCIHQEGCSALWADYHQQREWGLGHAGWSICHTAHAVHCHTRRWDHGVQDGWVQDSQVDSGRTDHPDQWPQLPLSGLPPRPHSHLIQTPTVNNSDSSSQNSTYLFPLTSCYKSQTRWPIILTYVHSVITYATSLPSE